MGTLVHGLVQNHQNNVICLQVWLSTVMFDPCNIFKNLQKVFQKSNLILLDVRSARDAAIVDFNVLKEMPLPGGKEVPERASRLQC
jgi:hypothetical protein